MSDVLMTFTHPELTPVEDHIVAFSEAMQCPRMRSADRQQQIRTFMGLHGVRLVYEEQPTVGLPFRTSVNWHIDSQRNEVINFWASSTPPETAACEITASDEMFGITDIRERIERQYPGYQADPPIFHIVRKLRDTFGLDWLEASVDTENRTQAQHSLDDWIQVRNLDLRVLPPYTRATALNSTFLHRSMIRSRFAPATRLVSRVAKPIR